MVKKIYIVIVMMIVLILIFSVIVLAEWGVPILWEHSSAATQRMPWLAGNILYFVQDYDIVFSTWDGSKWSIPEPVPGSINTDANEINPAVIKGGKVLYFARYDPITDYDFYRSEWNEEKGEWGLPVLVEEISTDIQDWDVWVSEDETLLYLTTIGTFGSQESLGGRDIWKATRDGEKWTTPVNVGAPVNSESNEWSVFVGANEEIYFDSNRGGGQGNYDMWMVINETSEHINLGVPFNSADAERSMAFNDQFFFFASSKREGRSGYDLWYSVKRQD